MAARDDNGPKPGIKTNRQSVLIVNRESVLVPNELDIYSPRHKYYYESHIITESFISSTSHNARLKQEKSSDNDLIKSIVVIEDKPARSNQRVSKFAKTMERLKKQAASELTQKTDNSQLDDDSYDFPVVDYYDELSSPLSAQEKFPSNTRSLMRNLSSPLKRNKCSEQTQLLINKLPTEDKSFGAVIPDTNGLGRNPEFRRLLGVSSRHSIELFKSMPVQERPDSSVDLNQHSSKQIRMRFLSKLTYH